MVSVKCKVAEYWEKVRDRPDYFCARFYVRPLLLTITREPLRLRTSATIDGFPAHFWRVFCHARGPGHHVTEECDERGACAAGRYRPIASAAFCSKLRSSDLMCTRTDAAASRPTPRLCGRDRGNLQHASQLAGAPTGGAVRRSLPALLQTWDAMRGSARSTLAARTAAAGCAIDRPCRRRYSLICWRHRARRAFSERILKLRICCSSCARGSAVNEAPNSAREYQVYSAQHNPPASGGKSGRSLGN